MTKKRSTKRALLLSFLSLLMCVSMLIGSTYAWFTDSVTSAGNIIKSGTLDITMGYADGTKDVPADDNGWTNAESGAMFNYDKWEPGYVEVKHVRIANVGTLALKYQLNISANGPVSKLADAIDVYYTDPAVKVSDRTALIESNKLGTLAEVLANLSTTASGELEAGEADTITLAFKMRETAGNEYQNLSIGSDFNVQVMATQLTYEKDSFDNQYDVQATYLNKDADGAWLINNLDELFFLAADVNSGNSYKGETVKLTANIDLAGYNWIPIGSGDVNGSWIGFNGIFDGQGHTISNAKITKGGGWNGIFGLVGRGTTGVNESISNLTVKNVTIDGANRMSGGIVGQIYGNLENCHVENVTINAIPNWTGKEYDNGDKIGGIVGWLGDNGDNHYINGCTAKNVTLKAYRDVGGITGYIGSSTVVDKCAVDTVSITVDQNTNSYGAKDTNAGAIVGRTYNQNVTITADNTATNVVILIPTLISDEVALVDALASGKDVVLTNDVKMEAATTAPYGNKYGVKLDGGVIDGNGYELKIDCSGDDYGIMTSGGTIKNLTIKEGCRAVMLMYATEDVIIDNCEIGGDGVLYPINTGEHATVSGVDLIVTDSTLKGWTSFAGIESASFTNCKFEQGTYYNNIYGRVLKPYVNTTITDCSFIKAMNLDLSGLTQGQKVTFTNCTVDGQTITIDTFKVPTTDAEYDTLTFSVDLPSWASSISDCVVIN